MLDSNDPAAGCWEFPGGHLLPRETALEAARREWEEETGLRLPEGKLAGGWRSANGEYQGFVYVVPSEDSLRLEDRDPDRNPDGDAVEAVAWVRPGDLAHLDGDLRPELLADLQRVLRAVEGGPVEAGRHAAFTEGDKLEFTAEDEADFISLFGAAPRQFAEDESADDEDADLTWLFDTPMQAFFDGQQFSEGRVVHFAGDDWQAYVGPKGGKGWKNTKTGKVVYGSKQPGSAKKKPATPAPLGPKTPTAGQAAKARAQAVLADALAKFTKGTPLFDSEKQKVATSLPHLTVAQLKQLKDAMGAGKAKQLKGKMVEAVLQRLEAAAPNPKPSSAAWQPAGNMDDARQQAVKVLDTEYLGSAGWSDAERKGPEVVKRLNHVCGVLADVHQRMPGIGPLMKDKGFLRGLFVAKGARLENGVPDAGISPQMAQQAKLDRANGVYSRGGRIIALSEGDDGDSGPLALGAWNVDDSRAGIARHEYGHHVFYTGMTHAQRQEFHGLYQQERGSLKKQLSQYGSSNAEEAFAEAFSAYTHPEFNQHRDKVNKAVVAFLDQLLR